nr:MAG TPA: hypothetical protein [Caudoviricetes sp.]
MNLFSKLFRSRDKPQNHFGGLSFLFGQMAAGKAVNERTAMQTTAVYAVCASSLNPSLVCRLPSTVARKPARKSHMSIRCISCSTTRRTLR